MYGWENRAKPEQPLVARATALYAKKIGKAPHDPAVRGAYPNLVISTMFQAAWEKLFKYMCRLRVF